MNKENLVWLNNKIIPQSQANVNILSPTSQFGANVFEGIRGYWNEKNQKLYIFRLEDHTKRLLNSIKMMRLEDKYSFEYLIESLKDTVIKNNY